MHGLYLLWWVQERHMSPAVVASILAIGDLALIALELPTGWLADRYGHRSSLILGSFVQVMAMLWCWLGQGVAGLIMASALVAVGDAFRSGADQALLYRTCIALDREDSFQRIRAVANALELLSLVGLVLSGGVIVDRWGFAAGWTAEIALCALGLALSFWLVEPPRGSDPSAETSDAVPKVKAAVVTVLPLVVPTALLGAAASAASFLVQTAAASSAARVTALVAGITLAEAAGSAVAARVEAPRSADLMVLAVCGGGLVGVGLALQASHAVAPALAFLLGMAHPLRDSVIQASAGDAVRARAASVASAVDMLFATVTLPLVGLWRG